MPSANYDWFPDRHLGVAATLSHADELIGQMSDLLFSYQTQPDGIVQLCEVPDHHSGTQKCGCVECGTLWRRESRCLS